MGAHACFLGFTPSSKSDFRRGLPIGPENSTVRAPVRAPRKTRQPSNFFPKNRRSFCFSRIFWKFWFFRFDLRFGKSHHNLFSQSKDKGDSAPPFAFLPPFPPPRPATATHPRWLLRDAHAAPVTLAAAFFFSASVPRRINFRALHQIFANFPFPPVSFVPACTDCSLARSFSKTFQPLIHHAS